MNPLLKAVSSTIRKRKMIAHGQIVCAAISGGPDSTALLFILNELKETFGFRVKACHFDHALRSGSSGDARFAEKMVERLGLEFAMERDGSPGGGSIQSQARERRYRFFKKLLDSGYADLVATGHTLDDSVETSIMWMLRGAGPGAFGGVPHVREKYVRPLLDTRRSALLSWLERNDIEYVIDPTNDTDKYLRNRIRRHVIPALEIQSHKAVEAVARLAGLVKDQSLILESMANEKLTAITEKKYAGRLVVKPAALDGEPEAMRLVIYRMAFRSAGADPSKLSFKHLDAIESLLSSRTLGRSLDFPGGLCARLDHEGLTLGYRPKHETFRETGVTCPLQTPVGGRTLRTCFVDSEKVKGQIIDAEKAPSGALFRTRNPGDFLRIKGMSGRKKLKTFFIDRKIPSGMRDRIPLMACGSEILWIPDLFLAPSLLAGVGARKFMELSWD
ncbi:tRNA(Ile)-lysidine synthetase [hydrothermal vent metagenome]|uniref:tRNA(Ile)-lysidine synthetase n=1 Tax=hydrothermal vent metagenome TaxID=652676 RepID=A0A3B1BWH4_9ZZZZ